MPLVLYSHAYVAVLGYGNRNESLCSCVSNGFQKALQWIGVAFGSSKALPVCLNKMIHLTPI